MITLITAVPGSGKTLYAVQMIYQILSSKEPRNIYTNIDGLQVDKFPNSKYLHDAPDDWRETPDGSLVIYDECQQQHLYPATGRAGEVRDERLKAMEVHRHTGHDLIFITQSPTFVHHHVRKLVGEHIHLYRAMGLKRSSIYKWSHLCDNPNDRQEQKRADFSMLKFNKKYFELYKSATIHTHKFKFPKKLIYFLAIIGLIGIYIGKNLYSNGGLSVLPSDNKDNKTNDKDLVNHLIKPQTSINNSFVGSDFKDIDHLKKLQYGWSTTLEAVPVSGCISTQKYCQCFGKNGSTLAMTHAQCLSVLNDPLPINIFGVSHSIN